jgi:ABC-2 type transport system ATP-binding protein
MATATGRGGPLPGPEGGHVVARGTGLRGADGRSVRGADVTAEPGELVAVVGPAGPDRTSLLRELADRTRLRAGNAQVAGERWPGRGRAVRQRTAVARAYGAGAPDPYDRVGESLDLAGVYAGRRAGARAVGDALATVGLTVVEHPGVEAGDPPGVLARRSRYEHLHPADQILLAVALALVGGTEVLLVDAVDAGDTVGDGQDDAGSHRVWTGLRRVADRGTTVIAATASRRSAEPHADRLVPLPPGTAVGPGAPRPDPGPVRFGRRPPAHHPGPALTD